MPILEFSEVRRKPKTFRSMTSYDVPEFEQLLVHFTRAFEQKYPGKAQGRGRPNVHLQEPADKLFFILFYYKTYPLLDVQAYLFGMSQEQARTLIISLSEVLRNAYRSAGWSPERIPEELKKILIRKRRGTL